MKIYYILRWIIFLSEWHPVKMEIIITVKDFDLFFYSTCFLMKFKELFCVLKVYVYFGNMCILKNSDSTILCTRVNQP